MTKEENLIKAVEYGKSLMDNAGIPYGNIVNLKVNTRAKSRWGLCRRLGYNAYEIEISDCLLEGNVDPYALLNTVVHELIHSAPGCMKHTGEWKEYAEKFNAYYPGFNIKRCTSAEEKGMESRRKEPDYKYIFVCEDCGQVIKRQRRSKFVEHSENFRCGKCGGKFHQI